MMGDLRYALRMVIKSPGFTLVVFSALALGIGVNTTIFSVVNSLLLRPLPVGKSDRLVQMYTLDTRIGKQANSYLNYLDYERANTVFSGLLAYQFTPMGMTMGGETTNVIAQIATGNYWSVLEVQPALGRGFSPEEDTTPNGHPVVVLAHRFWKKLGGDKDIVGGRMILNGRTFTIVGVAAESFTGTDVGVGPDLWVPMAMRGWVMPANDWKENRRALMLNVIGRLRTGVSIQAAEAQLRTLARQLEQAYPGYNTERSVVLTPLEEAKSEALGGPGNARGLRNVSILFLAAAGSILLIACANVANLLLARTVTRRRELAIRLSLGAGRGRIIRQLLTESMLLGLLGGLGGIVLAYWLGDLLLTLIPPTPVPLSLDPQPDARVLGFAFVLALLSGVIFGLAPAWQTSRWDLTHGLRERVGTAAAPGWWNLRNLLVIGQVGASLLLLIGSGLFLKAFYTAQTIKPGFRTQNLALLTFDLNLAGYDKMRAKQAMREILDQVRSNPQVQSADLGQSIPLGFGGIGRTVFAEDRPPEAAGNRKLANISEVTPGYFSTMSISLLRGRPFSEQDCERPTPQAAIISEAMARDLWPEQNALGRRFRFFQGEPIEVVAIAQNVKLFSLGEDPAWIVYLPMSSHPQGGVTMFIYTAARPEAMLTEAERTVRRFDHHIAITYQKTGAAHLAFALWPSWMGAVLLGAFGVLALVLASMGVYGVMAYSVSQRTRELGIRMALGAQSHQVISLVLRQGMALAAIGLGLGLLLAVSATRWIGSLLYGVNPSDPLVFLGVTVLLAAAAFAACYFPARRAVRIDPVNALRFE
ncbi:MAG: ABC transporter permease [Chthoniobacterales bacterium]|nr:ABC transporter permease [Chthoniobacterales bacterium]